MRRYIDIITESLTENEDDYRGEHQAPDHIGGAPLHDLTGNGVYPNDVYGPRGYEYAYDDRTCFNIAMAYQGRPNRFVKIYRAVPADLGRVKINPGDWVTLRRGYATQHGRSHLNGDFKIISKTVSARDIFTDGNSLEEWGYAPQPYMSDAQIDEVRSKLGMPTLAELRERRRARIAAEKAALAQQEPAQAQDETLTEAKRRRKAPTIEDATEKDGWINRQTANRIVDPKGYFHSSSPLGGKRRP